MVKIRTGITDVLGNPLDGKPKPGSQPVKWRFEV